MASNLVRRLRKTFLRSPSSQDDSSSSDSEPIPFNIPAKTLDLQCAKIKARHPQATDTWIKNKATASSYQASITFAVGFRNMYIILTKICHQ